MILRLRKPLEKAIRSGHPWIFRDALQPFDAAPGTVVAVLDRGGRFLCRGLAEAGPIGVRVFTTDDQPLDAALIRQRIVTALNKRDALLPSRTTAMRLVHGEGDLLPGLVVDRYGEYAVVLLDGSALHSWMSAIEDALRPELAARSVSALLLRTKKHHDKSVVPVWGSLPDRPIMVLENDMKLQVDLVNGQKTGLFLDHRDSRLRVRSMSKGKKVLNLYGYTGGFSIAAGLGGATAVTTVDSASAAIAFAGAGWVENGLDPARHSGRVADVPAFMNTCRGQLFDLVISDPPSFAPKKSAVDGALKVYRLLHASVLRVMQSGGVYIAASCSSHIRREMFESTIRDGALAAGRTVTIADVWGAGMDHPVLKGFVEGQYLKVFKVLVR